MTVPSVGENAAEGCDDERWDLAGEANHAEHEGGVGHPVHEPTQGDRLHPRSDQGDALTDEEQAEVSVPESPENEFESA
jgi:hypothetical protein